MTTDFILDSPLTPVLSSSSGSRLQVEPSEEADPSSQRGAGEDRVSSSRCTEAQPLLEPWDRAAHQQQQVEPNLVPWLFSWKAGRFPKFHGPTVLFKTCSTPVARVTVAPDGVLWLYNISRADEGKYTCFAENYLGKANSTGHLSVRGSPPSHRSIPEASSCQLSSLLQMPPRSRWRHPTPTSTGART